ncbi:hypothetical protein LOAG_04696 [Loa loa]|uniref:Uncharacterized protein n=1 Tax=Loa loa TaxID=7209 RepID=A0A1S0U1V3_LOALO|nr:hypothetical protein LOAG_04696 [Loa loa]EFO23792.1 hypothetical protein LOAG_04696 [Loa loa]
MTRQISHNFHLNSSLLNQQNYGRLGLIIWTSSYKIQKARAPTAPLPQLLIPTSAVSQSDNSLSSLRHSRRQHSQTLNHNNGSTAERRQYDSSIARATTPFGIL